MEFHNSSSATLSLGGDQEPLQIQPHLGVPQGGYFVWDRSDFGYHQLQFDNHVFQQCDTSASNQSRTFVSASPHPQVCSPALESKCHKTS